MSAYAKPRDRWERVAFDGGLDQSTSQNRYPGLRVATNVVYRPFGALSKRAGSSVYGAVPNGTPIRSGYRWYRGNPTVYRAMVVQNGDGFYLGNDAGGAFNRLFAFPANPATPISAAFYASTYDPAESGVAGTPASDVMVVAWGGGAPLKWDGANAVVPLSPNITNPFTGVTEWHGHLWFWGDPSVPATLFATDIDNPEGFTFMLEFSPEGYPIGRGDGDPYIQRVINVGDVLYAFKTASIFAVTGYDFQATDVQFTIQEAVTDSGTTAPHSVANLRGSLIYWDGASFRQFVPGNTETIAIGTPIINSMARAAVGSQAGIQAFAGDFIVQTVDGYTLYSGFYLCAIDLNGTGVADTILAYDLDASALMGKPMWTVWTGLSIGAFIPWNGFGDLRYLYIGSATDGTVRLMGGDPTGDDNTFGPPSPIACEAQLGRYAFDTPDQYKRLDRAYLEAESTAATFEVAVRTDVSASTQPTMTTGEPGLLAGEAVIAAENIFAGDAGASTYQSPIVDFEGWVKGLNFSFDITESSNSSAWSLIALAVHLVEESQVR